MLAVVTYRTLCTVPLLIAALLLFALACAYDPDATPMASKADTPMPTSAITPAPRPTGTPTPWLTAKECRDRFDLDWAGAYPGRTAGQHSGSGVLEQRVLEKDLVVWAELANVEYKAVEIEAIKFELKGPTPSYESYKYTLLIVAEFRVREYLRGQGPDILSAIVEGQVAFNDLREVGCAKRVLEKEVGPLFGSNEGIALLESTSDPNFYHLGLAYANFKGMAGHRSTWLPYKTGSLMVGGREGALSLTELRQRVSSVLEEYNRRDDERWHDCVYDKYYDKGSDPWAYRGVPIPLIYYRDHHIIFNGEHVPVPAGTMIWISHDPYYGDGSGSSLAISTSMRLEGEDADLFEVTHHSEYVYDASEWEGSTGGMGQYLAIWYRPPEGRAEQWQSTTSGHVITAAEDLEEGEYTFNLHIEYGGRDFVDCGQDDYGPSEFTVIVDRDRPTTPPAPTNVRVVSKDLEGWTIVWDPTHGVGDHWVKVYRLDGDDEKIGAFLDRPNGLSYRIRFADMDGCGDMVYIKIYPRGDGKTYLLDYGEPSQPIEFRAEPCQSQ